VGAVSDHTSEDAEWVSPENPITLALRRHRYQPYPDRVCSCGASPEVRPHITDGDYEWWIEHLKGHI
jgi:hypothetical protein